MPRNPDSWRLSDRLAVALPAESGQEVADLLRYADKEPQEAAERLSELKNSRSAAVRRRRREELRREIASDRI